MSGNSPSLESGSDCTLPNKGLSCLPEYTDSGWKVSSGSTVVKTVVEAIGSMGGSAKLAAALTLPAAPAELV